MSCLTWCKKNVLLADQTTLFSLGALKALFLIQKTVLYFITQMTEKYITYSTVLEGVYSIAVSVFVVILVEFDKHYQKQIQISTD